MHTIPARQLYKLNIIAKEKGAKLFDKNAYKDQTYYYETFAQASIAKVNHAAAGCITLADPESIIVVEEDNGDLTVMDVVPVTIDPLLGMGKSLFSLPLPPFRIGDALYMFSQRFLQQAGDLKNCIAGLSVLSTSSGNLLNFVDDIRQAQFYLYFSDSHTCCVVKPSDFTFKFTPSAPAEAEVKKSDEAITVLTHGRAAR